MSQGLSLPNPDPHAPVPGTEYHSAAEVVKTSGLPESLTDVVTLVVGRCRLWKSEKVEVARELCGHFAEGLSRRATPEELIASFGEPRRAAQLITRAKRRNRSRWWKAQRDARRVLWTLLALMAGWYGYHAVRFYFGRPEIKFSVLERINAPSLAVPLSERAWPIYRDACKSLPAWPADDASRPINYENVCGATGEGRELLLAFARAGHPQVGAIRKAAAMKKSAFIVPGWEKDQRGYPAGGDYVWRGEEPAGEDPGAYSMGLPQLATYQRAAVTLDADVLLAMEEGRGDEAVADIVAMVGITRHVTEDGTVMSQMVSTALLTRACTAARALCVQRPTVLSESQLVGLMHALSVYRLNEADAEHLSLAVAELGIADLLQRIYTDNGAGNGHLTAASFSLDVPMATTRGDGKGWAGPLISGIVADRRTMADAGQRLYGAIREQIARPLYQRRQSEIDALCKELRGGVFGKGGASLVASLTSVELLAQRHVDEALMLRDATVAGLACELFCVRNGRYPSGWAEIVPSILPREPVDRWNGKSMCYRADAGELDPGRPLIYSVSWDGADNGGTFNANGAGRPVAQDWALWPRLLPPREPAAAGAQSAGFGWSWSGALLGE